MGIVSNLSDHGDPSAQPGHGTSLVRPFAAWEDLEAVPDQCLAWHGELFHAKHKVRIQASNNYNL
jgi:hypothetical protein